MQQCLEYSVNHKTILLLKIILVIVQKWTQNNNIFNTYFSMVEKSKHEHTHTCTQTYIYTDIQIDIYSWLGQWDGLSHKMRSWCVDLHFRRFFCWESLVTINENAEFIEFSDKTFLIAVKRIRSCELSWCGPPMSYH